MAELGIPYVAIFDRDVIQKTDTRNKFTVNQKEVEKVYLKEVSNDFISQVSLFNSEASQRRVRSALESKFKAGKQVGFPKGINSLLSEHNILMMRTEHETDIVDSKNLVLIAEMFEYDLTSFKEGVKEEEDVIIELKMLNKKALKKAFITAKLVAQTESIYQIPNVYFKMCGEIRKKINAAGLNL